MQTRSITVVLGLLLFVAMLAGCSRKNPEDVKVFFEGGKLVIVNNSGDDIFYHLSDYIGSAWIPVSLPTIQIKDGDRRTFDANDPYVRQNGIRVNWWHRGKKYDKSDLYGPDRVRKVLFDAATVSAALPPLPDLTAEPKAAAALPAVCKERELLRTWSEQRASGAATSELPPDIATSPTPPACNQYLFDCKLHKNCVATLKEQQSSLDELRTNTGYAPADYVTRAPIDTSTTTSGDTTAPRAAPAITPAAAAPPGGMAATKAAEVAPVSRELADVCRQRTLLEAWDESTARVAGGKREPPDFSTAAIPWACRDLVRDCEVQQSCPAMLAEQQSQLREVRIRASRPTP